MDATAMDPFLMLDHMGPQNWLPGEAKGAPWHPHRGFETVTYLIQGEFMHRDSMGSKGTLRPGDVQWMTAGSGVVHHEVPSPKIMKEGGVVEGFQLWVNLPRAHKMDNPRYQDVSSDKIPEVVSGDFVVRVIAGRFNDASAIINTLQNIEYLDFNTSTRGAAISHAVDPSRHGCIYVYRGSVIVGEGNSAKRVSEGQVGAFGDQGSLLKFVADDNHVRFLLLSGEPIHEPIAHQGPFVMNTRAELDQAYREYRDGNFVRHTAVFDSVTED